MLVVRLAHLARIIEEWQLGHLNFRFLLLVKSTCTSLSASTITQERFAEMVQVSVVGLALMLVVVSAIPLSPQTWSEELISMHETGPLMTPDQLAAMSNRVLLQANMMRRRLNELGISDADTDADIQHRFSSQDGSLGEGNSDTIRLEGASAKLSLGD